MSEAVGPRSDVSRDTYTGDRPLGRLEPPVSPSLKPYCEEDTGSLMQPRRCSPSAGRWQS